jgi:hypothetical protein
MQKCVGGEDTVFFWVFKAEIGLTNGWAVPTMGPRGSDLPIGSEPFFRG